MPVALILPRIWPQPATRLSVRACLPACRGPGVGPQYNAMSLRTKGVINDAARRRVPLGLGLNSVEPCADVSTSAQVSSLAMSAHGETVLVSGSWDAWVRPPGLKCSSLCAKGYEVSQGLHSNTSMQCGTTVVVYTAAGCGWGREATPPGAIACALFAVEFGPSSYLQVGTWRHRQLIC